MLSGAEPTGGIKAVFDCRLNPGPLTTDERRVLLEEYGKGLRSKETTMALLGTDDIEAELERMDKEGEAAAEPASAPEEAPEQELEPADA